ncbi:MAG: hypothetical protein LBQ24_00705 [Candidatus Peribacteria bacterium]|jgi:hypothetical protein|nr:hypothetical protein [Candidatus Peribacteria bacterium]
MSDVFEVSSVDTGVEIVDENAENLEKFTRLLRCLIEEIVKNTIKHPKTSQGLLPGTYVLLEMAINPETSADILAELASIEIFREEIAGNPNTPLKALEILAKDKSEFVRIAVARNPNAPLEIPKIDKRSDDKVRKIDNYFRERVL